MMKLYIVIYLLGKVSGVVGPVPYGMGECHKRLEPIKAQWSRAAETGYSEEQKRPLTADEWSTLKTMEFKCEEHMLKPNIIAE